MPRAATSLLDPAEPAGAAGVIQAEPMPPLPCYRSEGFAEDLLDDTDRLPLDAARGGRPAPWLLALPVSLAAAGLLAAAWAGVTPG